SWPPVLKSPRLLGSLSPITSPSALDDGGTRSVEVQALAFHDRVNGLAKALARAPIEGIPVTFSGSYDEAKQMAYQMKRLRHLDVHDEHHLAIFTSILSDNGLQGYNHCLDTQANLVGTFLSASRDAASTSHFFVNVTWRGPVGVAVGKFDFVGNSPFIV